MKNEARQRKLKIIAKDLNNSSMIDRMTAKEYLRPPISFNYARFKSDGLNDDMMAWDHKVVLWQV